jgi:hypothetical protein
MLSKCFQVNLQPLAIIHIVLKGIPAAGTPPRLIYEYLKAYFKDDGSLVYKEIVFDLKDEKQQVNHWDLMTELANKLNQ